MKRLTALVLPLLTMLLVSGCGINVNTGGNAQLPATSAAGEASRTTPTAAGPSSADIQATVEASVNATQAALKAAAPTSAPAPTQAATTVSSTSSATETPPTPGTSQTETLPTQAAPAPTQPAPASPVANTPPPILLILDSSGSMLLDAGNGQTKIQAAKNALTSVVDALPDGAPVGLRVYGATVPNTDKANGCKDTQLVAPVAPLDKPAMKQAINSFEAKGWTPISLSLEQGFKDLPPEGQRTMILVSDGEETCVPDPCAIGAQLKQQGVDLVVNTVGFQVNDQARSQLQCIAQQTGGQYYDASSADQLVGSLQEITKRALQGYETVGANVPPGSSFNNAPTVPPGQYKFNIINGETKYYAVEVQPGQRLSAVATLVGQQDLGLVNVIGASLDLKGYNTLRQEATPFSTKDNDVNVGNETVNVSFTTDPIGSNNELQPGKYYVARSYGMVNGQLPEKLRNRQFEAELIIEVK